MSIGTPKKRARVVNNQNTLDELSVLGNATIGGTLDVGGDTIMRGDLAMDGNDVTDLVSLEFVEQSSTPTQPPANVYLDDGTNAPVDTAGNSREALGVYSVTESAWMYTPPFAAGSWTPVVGDGANPFTAGARAGRWTRIGNLVVAEFKYNYTDLGLASGSIVLQGLPFKRAAYLDDQWGEIYNISLVPGVSPSGDIRVRLRLASAVSSNWNFVAVDYNPPGVSNYNESHFISSGGLITGRMIFTTDNAWPSP